MRITTDLIIGAGLTLALLLSLFIGSTSEFQTSLASGLLGYLGRTAIARAEDKEELK